MMDDMNNLESFLDSKTKQDYGGNYCGFDDFSIDDLKELRYLASLALVKKLAEEHGEIMKSILQGVGDV